MMEHQLQYNQVGVLPTTAPVQADKMATTSTARKYTSEQIRFVLALWGDNTPDEIGVQFQARFGMELTKKQAKYVKETYVKKPGYIEEFGHLMTEKQRARALLEEQARRNPPPQAQVQPGTSPSPVPVSPTKENQSLARGPVGATGRGVWNSPPRLLAGSQPERESPGTMPFADTTTFQSLGTPTAASTPKANPLLNRENNSALLKELMDKIKGHNSGQSPMTSSQFLQPQTFQGGNGYAHWFSQGSAAAQAQQRAPTASPAPMTPQYIPPTLPTLALQGARTVMAQHGAPIMSSHQGIQSRPSMPQMTMPKAQPASSMSQLTFPKPRTASSTPQSLTLPRVSLPTQAAATLAQSSISQQDQGSQQAQATQHAQGTHKAQGAQQTRPAPPAQGIQQAQGTQRAQDIQTTQATQQTHGIQRIQGTQQTRSVPPAQIQQTQTTNQAQATHQTQNIQGAQAPQQAHGIQQVQGPQQTRSVPPAQIQKTQTTNQAQITPQAQATHQAQGAQQTRSAPPPQQRQGVQEQPSVATTGGTQKTHQGMNPQNPSSTSMALPPHIELGFGLDPSTPLPIPTFSPEMTALPENHYDTFFEGDDFPRLPDTIMGDHFQHHLYNTFTDFPWSEFTGFEAGPVVDLPRIVHQVSLRISSTTTNNHGNSSGRKRKATADSIPATGDGTTDSGDSERAAKRRNLGDGRSVTTSTTGNTHD